MTKQAQNDWKMNRCKSQTKKKRNLVIMTFPLLHVVLDMFISEYYSHVELYKKKMWPFFFFVLVTCDAIT